MSSAIERLKQFIPSIKGISDSNRKGLLHIVTLLEEEQFVRDDIAKYALRFYADKKRHEGSNSRPFEGDSYTDSGAPYMQDIGRDGGLFARNALRMLDK